MKSKYINDFGLLYTIAKMDLKSKYQNNKLGFLWSFFKPVLQFCVYYLTFQVILNTSNDEDYPLRLFLGVLLWSFFTEATGSGMMAYFGKKSIITKVSIKKEILPVAAYLTAFMNFCFTMIVFLVIYHMFGDFKYMYNLPNLMIGILALVAYSIFIISMNVILATLNVLFRDMQSIWEVVLMFGVFLTPIIYPLPIDPMYLKYYYFLNPIAYPIELIKGVFFYSEEFATMGEYAIYYLASLLLWTVVAVIVDITMKNKVVDYL